MNPIFEQLKFDHVAEHFDRIGILFLQFLVGTKLSRSNMFEQLKFDHVNHVVEHIVEHIVDHVFEHTDQIKKLFIFSVFGCFLSAVQRQQHRPVELCRLDGPPSRVLPRSQRNHQDPNQVQVRMLTKVNWE